MLDSSNRLSSHIQGVEIVVILTEVIVVLGFSHDPRRGCLCKGSFTHAIFNAIFVAFSQATFVASVN